MKLTLSAIQNIDVLGELLRDLFFEQRHGVGCYETFICREYVDLLDSIDVEYNDCFHWVRRSLTIDNGWYLYGLNSDQTDTYVEMWYYWDGDGTLVFILADFVLLNTDCRKDYHWKKISHKEWQSYRSG